MIDKKRKEKHHKERFLDLFKQKYPDFSFGNEVKQEEREGKDPKPDFLFEGNSIGKLGIEHTEIYQNEGGKNKKTTLQAIEEYQAKIVYKAKEIICEDKKIPPLSCTVFFNNMLFEGSPGVITPISRNKENLNILSQKLAEFVKANYSKVKKENIKNFTKRVFPQFKLRDCFNQVIIRRFASLQKHRWEANNTLGWVSRDIIYRLQQRIDAKNKEIDEYLKKCDKCWLLVVGQTKASQFFQLTPETEQHEFNSKFERVFYLRYLNNELIELKVCIL